MSLTKPLRKLTGHLNANNYDITALDELKVATVEATGVTSNLILKSGDGSAFQPRMIVQGNLPAAGGALLTVASFLQMDEIAKPSNPAAGSVRIYPKDKGGNITGLFALFDDGTEVEIATEV